MSASRENELQQELNRRKDLETELASRRKSISPQQSETENNAPWGINPSDLNRTPLDVVRDIGAGLARGSQNLASGLLEAGEYATRKGAEKLGRDLGHPVDVPYWNAREFMGLEGNRPIDLGAAIQSKAPDPLSTAIGQYGLPTLAGGPNAIRQMLMQGGYGASQATPEQQNALGLLPQGRLGAGIEQAALAGVPFAIPKMVRMAKNAIANYVSPQKTVTNFLNELSQGKSIPENIQELSQRIKYGRETAKEEALIPKREIMSKKGEETIFPSQVKGNELTQNTASIPNKPIKGEYLNIKNPDKYYSDFVQEAHNEYSNNPTFKNSDILRSRLFKRINELNKRKKAGTLTDNQELELPALIKSRNAIIKDQDNLISTFSPIDQEKYGKFNKLWRENVRAYDDAGNTIKNLKNGFLNKVTPQNITNAFSFPELKPQIQKVLKDIGPQGLDNIIYNEIGRLSEPKKILDLLDRLERTKGFAPYMSPKVRQFAEGLRKQIRNKKIAIGVGATTGIGGLSGLSYGLMKNIFG